MIADEDAIEVTIDKPTTTYNLHSRSGPTFGSYSNPNNVQLHQQTHSDLDFSINIDEIPCIGELDKLYQPDDVFLDAVSAASADVNHEAQSL